MKLRRPAAAVQPWRRVGNGHSRRVDGLIQRIPKAGRGQEGAALVEMALSSAVFLSVMIGAFAMILALYSYHFVADIAREATRYASVRGSQSCINTPTLPNCNTSTSAPIQTWVRGRQYPFASSLNVVVSYLKPTISGTPATTTWSACTSGTCNLPGNMVKVAVTFAYPISIPFWRRTTINLGSTSSMIISQ
jgi:Flp pilus assembly protein TadG